MSETFDEARHALNSGQLYPYDASDKWWAGDADDESGLEPPSGDWAVRAARGVVANLTDRRAIKHGFDNITEDVRAEIVQTLAAIIRAAQADA